MKRVLYTFSLAAVVASGGITASSQEAEPASSAAKVGAKPPSLAVNDEKPLSPFSKASTFIGTAIKSSDGKALGKVHDLVFNLERGELSYAVVALEGPNGASRRIPVPVRALKPAQGHLILNVSESVVAAAEGLQEGEWPGTEAFAVGGPASAESGSESSKNQPGEGSPSPKTEYE